MGRSTRSPIPSPFRLVPLCASASPRETLPFFISLENNAHLSPHLVIQPEVSVLSPRKDFCPPDQDS